MPERKKISDTCLLNRLVDGEMKAYEEIFVRYYPTLCTYARMYVKREETAENIVQDLMLWYCVSALRSQNICSAPCAITA